MEYLIENYIYLIVDEIYCVLEDYFLNMSVVMVYNNLCLFIEIGFV